MYWILYSKWGYNWCMCYSQSISELERDLDQLNMSMAQKSDNLDHDRWALHMELEKVSTVYWCTNNVIRNDLCKTAPIFSTRVVRRSLDHWIDQFKRWVDYSGHLSMWLPWASIGFWRKYLKLKVLRVAECNVGLGRLLQSNDQLSSSIQAKLMKLKNVDNIEVS